MIYSVTMNLSLLHWMTKKHLYIGRYFLKRGFTNRDLVILWFCYMTANSHTCVKIRSPVKKKSIMGEPSLHKGTPQWGSPSESWAFSGLLSLLVRHTSCPSHFYHPSSPLSDHFFRPSQTTTPITYKLAAFFIDCFILLFCPPFWRNMSANTHCSKTVTGKELALTIFSSFYYVTPG